MNVTQRKEKADHEHIDHGGVRLPVGDTPLLYTTVGTQARHMFVEGPFGKTFMLEISNCLDCVMPGGDSTVGNNFTIIFRFMIVYFFCHGFNELN